MTESTHYEPPTLIEVGSVRSLTQADYYGDQYDGYHGHKQSKQGSYPGIS